ncbi:MAG: 2OG-Fe(II) oxygenase [Flavipsychrobacter sp.]|nr:2OG-Fe(II) oxygenase [Flavipsychrobacter sp.]
MEAKFEELIEGFITDKIGISESFLSIPLAAALQQNLLRLKRDSRMIRANIGNAVIKDKNQKARGDKTCWLDIKSKNPAEMEFLDIIRQFLEQLNKTCYTGLNAFEFHYALYEVGTSYSRHKDQLRNDYNRKFSMISYLNEDWIETDGGQLVIHHDEDSTQEIFPNNQKTLFFQSDVLEHEVVTATRPRMSITGWLKRV